ncbi:signal peptidase I [Enterococcus quebecensis]|uniref:Signal peptidase I n=1 Tax=Enterococcus quebecensis TaxID=903983 RepID=A0A1E5H3W7_9ENTE|nr:signal peptidase I [Enterococcus quebecensis]
MTHGTKSNNLKKKQTKKKKGNIGYSKNKKQRKLKRMGIEIGCSVLIAGVFIWILSIFFFTFAKVEGYSMLSSLWEDDLVYINKRTNIGRFKLVYFETPDQQEKAIRRVIGLPGEFVEYKDDELYINNEKIEEKFIDKQDVTKAKSMGLLFTENFDITKLKNNQQIIPKDFYLVLGDNRPYSTDSRYYGFIHKNDIIGVVEMRILPLHLMEKFNR